MGLASLACLGFKSVYPQRNLRHRLVVVALGACLGTHAGHTRMGGLAAGGPEFKSASL